MVADGAGPPGQHKESGLERILGRVDVAGDALADAQNHRTMPLQEDFESGFVAANQEPLQECAIARVWAIELDVPLAQKSQEIPQ
jgi:hypothetical protein